MEASPHQYQGQQPSLSRIKTQVTSQQTQFYFNQLQNRITFYLSFKATYLESLFKKTKVVVPQNLLKHLGTSCIVYQQYSIRQEVAGNIQLHHAHYKGLTINNILTSSIHISAAFAKIHHHDDTHQWQAKIYPINKPQQPTSQFNYYFHIPIVELKELIKSSEYLLIEINFLKYHGSEGNNYRGIENIGNTCYLNTVLQIIYFLRPIRKIIIEDPHPKSLTAKLQQLYATMEVTTSNSVNAENVLKHFFELNQFRMEQQDIHEFMIRLFEELEQEIPIVKQFWEGRGKETTQSTDKKYISTQDDIFNVLDLYLPDSHTTIHQSLKHLFQEEAVQQLIQTQQHGSISVTKKRTILQLPQILFLNLKRYKYNPQRKALEKILSVVEYPQSINLSFLLETPDTDNEHEYILYAVTIHKGRSPHSGHYYCFINTSEHSNHSSWYKFNDSCVNATDASIVLNGRMNEEKEYVLNKQKGIWQEYSLISDQTPYLLVYIRKEVFQEYQQVKCEIPRIYIQREAKRNQIQEDQTTNVKLFMLEQNNCEAFDPFTPEEHQDLLEIPLNKAYSLIKQLKEIQMKFIPITVGTVWKVNKKRNIIKYCGKKYGKDQINVQKIINNKLGHEQPDYILVISLQLSTTKEDNIDDVDQLVLVKVSYHDARFNYYVINRVKYHDFVAQIQKQTGKKILPNDTNHLFQYKWNDFIVLNLL